MQKVHALWSVLSNLLLLVLGVIFIAWKDEILIGLGGALVGAGVAGLMSTLKTLDAWTQIHEVISLSKNHGFASAETDVAGLRKLFHHYHVTRLDEEWVWRYERVDLGSTHVPGALVADVAYFGKEGEARRSIFRAGVVDNRLVATNKEARVREDADVYVYPRMMEPGSVHAGLEMRVTLDRNSAFMPGLLAEKAIDDWTTVGTVTNPRTTRILNQCWATHMKDSPTVLPSSEGTLVAIQADCSAPRPAGKSHA